MKTKNKQRTATDRKANKKLSRFGNKCEWWDDGYPECALPWTHRCNGDIFQCKKLYYAYLASVNKPSALVLDEFNRRQHNQ